MLNRAPRRPPRGPSLIRTASPKRRMPSSPTSSVKVTTLPLDDPHERGRPPRGPGRAHHLQRRTLEGMAAQRALPLRDIFARLATGYAKRFWKQGNRYLGETLYLDGRIRVKHSLEEFTLDRPVNDLDPGKYILLRYTDPVFEHLFYDVMRAADDGVIVYGGYTGRFPDGKRGFTGVLMRRYSFAELGERDHEQLVRKAQAAGEGRPERRLAARRGRARPITRRPSRTCPFVPKTGGKVGIQCEPVDSRDRPRAGFRRRALHQRRQRHDSSASCGAIDDQTMVGTWHAGDQPAVRAVRRRRRRGCSAATATRRAGATRCGTC